MATHRRCRRRRRTRWPRQTPAGSPQNVVAADGSTALPRANKRRKPLPCQEQEEEDGGYARPTLPELQDIWCHIHSLLPLRDAARAACVSHAFRRSWRRLPNLTFTVDSLGLTTKDRRKESIAREFNRKVESILKNHSRTGVRMLELRLASFNMKRDNRRLGRWLETAVTPGIEKVSLNPKDCRYMFPCSLLLDEKRGSSIRHLQLSNCSLICPTAGRPWCLRSLVKLDLSSVDVVGDGLWCLLSSSSPALERVTLRYCSGITSLNIPGSLRRLGYLRVSCCDDLQAVESKAPNLSSFHFKGDHLPTHTSLGEALRLKELRTDCSSYSCCTRAELVSSSMPDAETIVNVHPSREIDKPSELSSKSAHLERLYIAGIGRTPFYLRVKYSALLSLFGASHSVEDLVSYVSSQLVDHVLFCSAIPGGKRSCLSTPEERMVQEACHMLKAWLS